MNLEYYVDKIKFQLTGNVLESELTDDDYAQIIKISLQEINRYYNTTGLVMAPGDSCIDLKKVEEDNKIEISSVVSIHRIKSPGIQDATTITDPMYVSYWNTATGLLGTGSNRWVLNYAAYNTLQQLGNTLSTDLDFREDKLSKKLYVSYNQNGNDTQIAIEYVPRLTDCEQVVGDHWINVLSLMSLAYAKITLGRIRTRFTQSNALWTQDGETLLAEGKEELKAIQDRLQAQNDFFYPLD